VALDSAARRLWMGRAGYCLLAMFSFGYFLFLGFPFDRLLTSPAIARSLDGFERDNGMKLDVGSVRGGWLFDVVARDVKITATNPVKRASATDTPEEPMLKIDTLVLRPAPFSLLTGKLGLHLDAALYGGHLRGTIAVGRTRSVTDLAVSNLDLSRYSSLSTKWGVNLVGTVGGTVALLLDFDDGAKSSGKIDLAVKNAAIGESNVLGIQKIPRTVFDKGAGALVIIKDGRVDLQDVGLHGDDLDLAIDGGIDLKKKLGNSLWDARTTIKGSEAFKQQVSLLFDTFLSGGKCNDLYRYKLSGPINRLAAARPDVCRK
jgi:type II secretion system protein N